MCVVIFAWWLVSLRVWWRIITLQLSYPVRPDMSSFSTYVRASVWFLTKWQFVQVSCCNLYDPVLSVTVEYQMKEEASYINSWQPVSIIIQCLQDFCTCLLPKSDTHFPTCHAAHEWRRLLEPLSFTLFFIRMNRVVFCIHVYCQLCAECSHVFLLYLPFCKLQIVLFRSTKYDNLHHILTAFPTIYTSLLIAYQMRWWRHKKYFYFNADLTGTGSLPTCIWMYDRQDAGTEDYLRPSELIGLNL